MLYLKKKKAENQCASHATWGFRKNLKKAE